MVDYRPVSDERAVFHEYRSYAFRPEAGVPAYDPDEHETPRDTLGARRGLYADESAPDDGQPRAVCRHYWLEAQVRGDTHRTAGLASVATPPEHRRRGYVRDLLAHSLAEYRDHDVRFSVLWPFSYRFYRQYGWETSNRIQTHECDPETLAFATTVTDAIGSEPDDDPETARFRRLEPDDYPRLEDAYEDHAARYGLALERDGDWWRHRVFGGHDRDSFVAAVERDGDVSGYLVYTIDDEGGDRTMAVSELVAVDHDAFLALLSYCHVHDSQVDRVRLRLPADVPLRDVARSPDEIETTVTNGPMVRIVDVVATLSALSYPDCDTDTTIAVDDPLVDWNDGTFRLSVAGGEATCERIADDPDAASADVRLDVAALSALAVGARTASRLERTGDLWVADPDALETLETHFPETTVYLGHFF